MSSNWFFLTLTDIEWLPETGLTTAAMKLKRKPLSDHYDLDIKRKMSNTCPVLSGQYGPGY